MARAYSQDLRDRAIDAALAGLPARHAAARFGIGDLPLNFPPAATRVPVFDMPEGADVATGDRRSRSGLRSRSPVAMRWAVYSTGVAQPIEECGHR